MFSEWNNQKMFLICSSPPSSPPLYSRLPPLPADPLMLSLFLTGSDLLSNTFQQPTLTTHTNPTQQTPRFDFCPFSRILYFPAMTEQHGFNLCFLPARVFTGLLSSDPEHEQLLRSCLSAALRIVCDSIVCLFVVCSDIYLHWLDENLVKWCNILHFSNLLFLDHTFLLLSHSCIREITYLILHNALKCYSTFWAKTFAFLSVTSDSTRPHCNLFSLVVLSPPPHPPLPSCRCIPVRNILFMPPYWQRHSWSGSACGPAAPALFMSLSWLGSRAREQMAAAFNWTLPLYHS